MFKFILGVIVGSFFSFISLVAILVSDVNIDMALITNIVIAIATVVATAIHFDSIAKQRNDRIWEINKDMLLNLAHSLSLVIYASEYYSEVEYNRSFGINESPRGPKPKEGVYEAFKNDQEKVLNVYRTLMNKELISSLKSSKEKNDWISEAVEHDAIDHQEAYDASIKAYKELQNNLNDFMARISGVKNI
ncbi:MULTISPECIES: hypothetical protein [unclassified Vibrio]|uniref:hypothetical protein n=1 Tax=unclassified Vibrio TaxID=2614977 RepID=UPI00159E5F39|nr:MULTISPECIES: hypothetical protein [unclassified Vibrio]NVN80578.1 hypothetical protein [Vibrio sp. Scap16]QLE95608.1 hypothetical protein FLM53_21800 [Vibrio sp. Scap24]